MALLQAQARLERAGVVGDRHRRQFHVGKRRLVEQTDLLGFIGQLTDGFAERLAEFLVALFQEIIRIFLEELQVELEHAVAMAELVRVRRRKSGDLLRHIHQSLPGDSEHLIAPRNRKQSGLVPGKRLAALIGGGVEIDRVADAKCKNLVDRERLLAQYRPDVAGLLTGQRHHQVERERRIGNRGFDFSVKVLFEPFHIRRIRHSSLPRDQRRCVRRLIIAATITGCARFRNKNLTPMPTRCVRAKHRFTLAFAR